MVATKTPDRRLLSSPAEQEPFKQALATAARAVAARADVEVVYSQSPPGLAGLTLRLMEPKGSPHAEARTLARGHADALALKLRCHRPRWHRQQSPTSPEGRALFERAEDARIEAWGRARYPGMVRNLQARLVDRLGTAAYAQATTRDDVPLDEAFYLMTLEAVTKTPLPPLAASLLDLWRPTLALRGGERWAQLSTCVDDQRIFGQQVRLLLEALQMQEQNGDDAAPDDAASDEAGADAQGQEGETQTPQASDANVDDEVRSELSDEQAGERQAFEGMEMGEGATEWSDEEPADVPASQRRNTSSTHGRASSYKAYLTTFDEVLPAEKLCDAAELDKLRAHLDRQLQNLQGVVARLANRLQRRLLAKQNRAWVFDCEEGQLDTSRLVRVVTDPLQPLSFKRENDTDFRDTVVTLLIDNSGSMRGRPITIAATCADILARTLERCAVKVEILGFTTKAWKGGQTREAWMKDGKPAQPGRLNDLRHIIYKSADSPWRRAKRHLGLMLREGLLKENIDGEALAWAAERLRARPEDRKILMMISDGAPVDDSTLSANTGPYLENHLREVIETIEGSPDIELVAIGIGHDVTRYYRRAVTIVDAEDLGGAMIDELVGLFDA